MARFLPLSRPCVGRPEAAAAARAILDRNMIGRGALGLELEKRMARDMGARHALLTTSGTHALELALAACGVGPGDEVILPSFTFSSVATAVLRQGARPVFCDIDPATLNMDPEDAGRRVTKRTKAIIPVHYAGIACDMKAILKLARSRGLRVIEDAAHAVGAKWRGRALGTLGHAGCVSFHATKNITCGEGGALLTNSHALARRAELFREKGTNRSAFIRGEVKKYTWVSEGSSYVLSDILTAVLAEQWKRVAAINAKRGALFALYQKLLRGTPGLTLPTVPAGCEPSWHLYFVLLPSQAERDRCMAALKKAGIGAAFHYQPLHASPFARRTLGWKARLPVSESAGGRLLRLPLFPDMTRADVRRVCAALKECL